jgi:hypothetical protein
LSDDQNKTAGGTGSMMSLPKATGRPATAGQYAPESVIDVLGHGLAAEKGYIR